MSAAAVVIGIVFFAAHKYFIYSFIQRGRDAGLGEDHVFFVFLRQQEVSLDRIFLVVFVTVAAAIVYFSLRLSNQIAGPLYRLNRHMTDVAQGHTDRPVAFRKGDYFPELADAYNAQLETLKGAQSAKATEDRGEQGVP